MRSERTFYALTTPRYSHTRHYTRIRDMRIIALLSLLLVLPMAQMLAQAKPGQVIANVETDDGKIAVANGSENQVLLTVKETTISFDAEEGLRVANWLKEGQGATYAGSGPIKMTREADDFLLTLSPTDGDPIPLRLDKEQGFLLGTALASARQNVSEAGN